MGNPGPGGWAAIVQQAKKEHILKGHESMTTNNRMEMTAAIKALQHLKTSERIHLYTDSQYLRLGMLEWMPKWKKNQWRTANKKPVKNKDLWESLDTLCQNKNIEWHWIKGHAGHPENERADALARSVIPESTA